MFPGPRAGNACADRATRGPPQKCSLTGTEDGVARRAGLEAPAARRGVFRGDTHRSHLHHGPLSAEAECGRDRTPWRRPARAVSAPPPSRSPPVPLALRGQGNEGRESAQIRCESGVRRGDWRTGEATVLTSTAHSGLRQDGRSRPSGGVAKGARISPRCRTIGGASVRWRRRPGSFPSLPWPRRATSASGARPRRSTPPQSPSVARRRPRKPRRRRPASGRRTDSPVRHGSRARAGGRAGPRPRRPRR
jgi:hypothetical protein